VYLQPNERHRAIGIAAVIALQRAGDEILRVERANA
jgi:hypothetical protein